MRRILNNMWTFVLLLLVIAMGFSTAFYWFFMRSRM
jgi:hypothetical protein